MDERRTARVSEAIREELLEIVGFEMADPRVRNAAITSVALSQDGRHATVRISAEGEAKERKQTLTALENASGFLRHELAARLGLRLVPELQFEIEKFPDADRRIEILLKRAGKTRGRVE